MDRFQVLSYHLSLRCTWPHGLQTVSTLTQLYRTVLSSSPAALVKASSKGKHKVRGGEMHAAMRVAKVWAEGEAKNWDRMNQKPVFWLL